MVWGGGVIRGKSVGREGRSDRCKTWGEGREGEAIRLSRFLLKLFQQLRVKRWERETSTKPIHRSRFIGPVSRPRWRRPHSV